MTTTEALPTDAHELIAAVRSLLQRVDALETELVELRSENAALRRENAELRVENAKLRRENTWLKKQLFGPSRERVPAAKLEEAWSAFQDAEPTAPAPGPLPSLQLLLGLAEPPASTTPPAAPSPPPAPPLARPKRRHAHGRNALPEHLAVETIVFEPESVPEGAVRAGEEITERLGHRPACFVRLVIVRPKYAQRDEHGATQFLVADPPSEMVPRGLCDPAMLARLVTAKWADHQPWHRLVGIVARSGVHLAASTMAGAVARAEPLARFLVDAMWTDARTHAKVLAIDATTVKVRAQGKCRRGYPWIVVADRDHVLFGYSTKHSGDVPARLLKGFRGHVVADASSVYDAFFEGDGAPHEAGCWSHARRKFVFAGLCDERALVGVRLADQLFAIERELVALDPTERRRLRQQRSVVVLDTFARWREGLLRPGVLDPRGPFLKALAYTARHWAPLRRFLENGDVPIHNNFTELQARHVAVGRNNWLFFGSDPSAETACTWLSLIASAKLWDLDPEAYLRDLFRVLPDWPRARLLELAPKHWARTRAALDADDLAKPLGPVRVRTAVNLGAQDAAE